MSEVDLQVNTILCEALRILPSCLSAREESKIEIQKTNILISHWWNWMEFGNEISLGRC